MTTVEVEFVIKAAKMNGISPADFIRLATLARAQIVIEATKGNPAAAPPMPEVRRGILRYTTPLPKKPARGESESWDVRQMKRRLRGGHLKMIKGGKADGSK